MDQYMYDLGRGSSKTIKTIDNIMGALHKWRATLSKDKESPYGAEADKLHLRMIPSSPDVIPHETEELLMMFVKTFTLFCEETGMNDVKSSDEELDQGSTK